ncbi:MAG: putative carboxymuconolactone decarboxylase [Planctomycetota bacterium]|nr:MAG: putative carboxymuconolactone decarboxylase [Planctomycetota bacterium]
MAHIQLPDGEPGISGLLVSYRDTETHLNGLAQAAMRGPSSLSEAERELIAAYVSARNDCVF